MSCIIGDNDLRRIPAVLVMPSLLSSPQLPAPIRLDGEKRGHQHPISCQHFSEVTTTTQQKVNSERGKKMMEDIAPDDTERVR